jgi:hypothetical protein
MFCRGAVFLSFFFAKKVLLPRLKSRNEINEWNPRFR